MAKNAHIPVFILAGGLGTRISEETQFKPKPMVEIGSTPILVHIMRWYYAHGFNDFVICAGYKSWEIKNFFLNYEYRANNLVVDHRTSICTPPTTLGVSLKQERWRVRVLDTGTECMTGGRVGRALEMVSREQEFDDFALTYGDGLSDVDLEQECRFHLEHGKIGTVLGVKNPARYGVLDIDAESSVSGFLEKPTERQETISGGFFFFKRAFQKYLSQNAECILERAPMETIARIGQLKVFSHTGFWHAMDTLRDKKHLEDLWEKGKAPWVKHNLIEETRREDNSRLFSFERSSVTNEAQHI